MKAQLFTAGKHDMISGKSELGGFVAEIEMMPFVVLPEGVIWGSRFFVLHDHEKVIYREGLCWMHLDGSLFAPTQIPGKAS